jgi:hypothetical protein
VVALKATATHTYQATCLKRGADGWSVSLRNYYASSSCKVGKAKEDDAIKVNRAAVALASPYGAIQIKLGFRKSLALGSMEVRLGWELETRIRKPKEKLVNADLDCWSRCLRNGSLVPWHAPNCSHDVGILCRERHNP